MVHWFTSLLWRGLGNSSSGFWGRALDASRQLFALPEASKAEVAAGAGVTIPSHDAWGASNFVMSLVTKIWADDQGLVIINCGSIVLWLSLLLTVVHRCRWRSGPPTAAAPVVRGYFGIGAESGTRASRFECKDTTSDELFRPTIEVPVDINEKIIIGI